MSKPLKILVTGGAGFLGSHISDELSDRGYEVTVADLVESKWIRDDQKMAVGDITDDNYVREIVKDKDVIYHLAALADVNEARTDPVETARTNVLGTVKLLKHCVDASVKRIMFASTVYVYSSEGGFYRCSKQACENYIEEFHRMYDLNYSILRYGSLYGPRADEANGVYRFLKHAMTEGVLRHPGYPNDRREYIHVKDAAKLSVDVLNEKYKNTHLILTGNDTLKIRDLFYMISEILNRDITQIFEEQGRVDGHYRITPYTFTPKVGKKLTTPEYVDMGQGMLQVIEEIYETVIKKSNYQD